MWQWIVIWWLHDSHMLVTRQSHVDHTTVTCWSHDSHMLVTRQSHVGHMTVHAKMFMSLLCADQQYVTEYRLDVLGGPEGDTLHCFGIKYMGTHPTFASNATFPDKVWVCTCVCGVVGVGVCGWVCVCVCAYTSTGVGAVSSWFCVLKRRRKTASHEWLVWEVMTWLICIYTFVCAEQHKLCGPGKESTERSSSFHHRH